MERKKRVVLPCLWICGLILQECVDNIRQELSSAMDEMLEEPQPEKTGITQAECDQIYEKVLQEVLAEKEKMQASK